jgi:diphthamide synthase (EF-2-diphthine--ammonia ligase)
METSPERGAPVRAAGLERVAQRRDLTKAKASLALSWSGGKDSALALLALRAEFGRDPCALITTVTDAYNRISMHGVRRELLALQAQELGLPLVEVLIPPSCANEVYDARMRDVFASERLRSVAEVAFGDLFLEEVRAYREGRLAAAGKRGLFPLWGRDTTRLARHFIKSGFQAVLVCVDPRRLDSAFAGRSYDERLLAELPPEVDPCGENGSSTPLSTAGRSLGARSPARSATSSSAMASCSLT